MPDDDAVAAERAAAGQMVDARRDEWERTVPRRFVTARPADLVGPAGDALREWVADPHPGNLLLLGNIGVGKSHAAVAACRARFASGDSLRFLPVGELLDALDWRRPDSHHTLEQLCTVDLLVVDDLGTERSNEWTGERLYLVVNRRWLDERPTIVTTNLQPDQLADELGQRTYSRLRDSATAIMFTGEDRRHARG